ncbi:ATP-dependent helicase [Thermoflavifilum thermophilum]|uniref:DNA 3'-5' helicase n=1 Tax=Thermoflavifilum thermophilum TaxID=1393122 RepID=A0A1I7N9A8_9BACT|nr:UvrD-helicase domain-containing protein [Thermoflavifilum thermophilum]SFV31260.1 DNA helicase-2 / ATP-dependent DNA helicase PcrA [Thermoflavifilum thermophilum]
MHFLDELNERQREAVQHIDGPLMVIAGAGSGKTKVLTARIAYLIEQGVDPFHILALTFTNKAANEMKARIERMLGSTEARNLYIGTFHSVFARLLRADAHRLGYPSNFTIYDTDDSKNVLKKIIAELKLDDKHYRPGMVYNRISNAKNSLIGWEEYQQYPEFIQEDTRAGRPMIGKIFEWYAKRCFQNGAMDFDDLLYQMYVLLTRFPDALHKYQHKFQYILIDEYQDTNPAQYAIIKLLGAVHENICVVGDDAQSIYSFRGATIQNILQFEKDYEDVKVVKLEQNYRSTRSILSVANEVIAYNKRQLPKVLWTQNDEGEKIKLISLLSEHDEARFVADTIAEQKLRNHYANKDFAVLYRTNSQSRSFEEHLRRLNIPYKIYGGISFYQRKEIKDFLAYLRVIVNPKDEESLLRIINYPARGIGEQTLQKCLLVAREQGISLWEVLENIRKYDLRSAAVNQIEDFVVMIKNLQLLLSKENAYTVAVQAGKASGLVKELYNDQSVEGIARYENVQELLNAIKEFTETPDSEGELADKDLGSYLQQITLLTDADDEKEESDTVKLMTIHAAKGLEFPCVFVVGLEEGLFPNAMSINTRDELEEERRLFYVAVTRAKEKLWLTYAMNRYRFGNFVQNDPSRFISELPSDYVEKPLGRDYRTNHGSSFWQHQTQRKSPSSGNLSFSQHKPATAVHTPSPDFKPDDFRLMKEGMKVEHQKFGYGMILSIDGNASNPIATIRFELSGEKKIMLNYARLRIVRTDETDTQ